MIDWMRENVQGIPEINKSTKIVSLGSCFAREVKNWLLSNGFNYIVGEDDKFPWVSSEVFTGDNGTKPNAHASIAWERVYNTFTFKHIIEYTFNESRMEDRLLEVNCSKCNGKNYITDLFRTRILYPDMDTAQIDIEDHIRQSRKVLSETDILIFTLGLTEIWESQKRGIVIASHPGKHYGIPSDFAFRVSRFQENLDNLVHSFTILKKINKNMKFIVTVSPVHLLATSRNDLEVISASCNSKSTLRAVADEFQDIEGVYYFPSYEIATIAAALDGICTYPDNHHVSSEVVERIMEIFEHTSCPKGLFRKNLMDFLIKT